MVDLLDFWVKIGQNGQIFRENDRVQKKIFLAEKFSEKNFSIFENAKEFYAFHKKKLFLKTKKLNYENSDCTSLYTLLSQILKLA